MNSTSTLTSLAVLNVYVSQGSTYLDYLSPFILHVLIEFRPDPVKGDVVRTHLSEHFGLEIPVQTVETVLMHISHSNPIEKVNHVYRITGELHNPQLSAKANRVKNKIDSVVSGLIKFSREGIRPINSSDHAVAAICAFLSRFDVTCLRAAIQETVIPTLDNAHPTDVVQVSEFVQHIQRSIPKLFDDFLVLVQGNMLANALLCPDLHTVPPTFQNVDFYFDTPLLIRLLGLEDDSRQSAMRQLVGLLSSLGGKTFAFSHNVRELYGVVKGAATYLNSTDGRGAIIREARIRGTEKGDLLLLAEKLEEELAVLKVDVEDTPQYIDDFQIDESAFEHVLKDEVTYFNNPKAIDYDINSVRSIYAIRGQKSAPSLEKSSAVLVTSNNAFARAAWSYGQQYESSRDVSVVITDFSLANLAWLKAPMAAPEIPRTQLLAFSYAALMPSGSLLEKFMSEIDRLESRGSISARDLQVLRSSPNVNSELMHLTLGENAALTGETIIQTLDRVSGEIRKEETAKIAREEEAHRLTLDSLSSQVDQNIQIIDNIRKRCCRNARNISWAITIVSAAVYLAGLYQGFGAGLPISTEGRIVFLILAVSFIISALSTLFGFSFLNFRRTLEKQLMTRLLQRDARALGVEFGDLESE
jgi:hypothetical protein